MFRALQKRQKRENIGKVRRLQDEATHSDLAKGEIILANRDLINTVWIHYRLFKKARRGQKIALSHLVTKIWHRDGM